MRFWEWEPSFNCWSFYAFSKYGSYPSFCLTAKLVRGSPWALVEGVRLFVSLTIGNCEERGPLSGFRLFLLHNRTNDKQRLLGEWRAVRQTQPGVLEHWSRSLTCPLQAGRNVQIRTNGYLFGGRVHNSRGFCPGQEEKRWPSLHISNKLVYSRSNDWHFIALYI